MTPNLVTLDVNCKKDYIKVHFHEVQPDTLNISNDAAVYIIHDILCNFDGLLS